MIMLTTSLRDLRRKRGESLRRISRNSIIPLSKLIPVLRVERGASLLLEGMKLSPCCSSCPLVRILTNDCRFCQEKNEAQPQRNVQPKENPTIYGHAERIRWLDIISVLCNILGTGVTPWSSVKRRCCWRSLDGPTHPVKRASPACIRERSLPPATCRTRRAGCHESGLSGSTEACRSNPWVIVTQT